MTTSAFGIDHLNTRTDELAKGKVLNTAGAIGAAGALGAVAANPELAKPVGKTLRKLRGVLPGGAQPVGKSAFGVEHEVAKFAIPFTPKARRQKAEDLEAARSLQRRERYAAAFGGSFYTAAKAPKGKKVAAVKTQARHALSRPQSGGRATVGGYVKAKREHGF